MISHSTFHGSSRIHNLSVCLSACCMSDCQRWQLYHIVHSMAISGYLPVCLAVCVFRLSIENWQWCHVVHSIAILGYLSISLSVGLPACLSIYGKLTMVSHCTFHSNRHEGTAVCCHHVSWLVHVCSHPCVRDHVIQTTPSDTDKAPSPIQAD